MIFRNKMNLKWLFLNRNNITVLPESFLENQTNLLWLELNENHLTDKNQWKSTDGTAGDDF